MIKIYQINVYNLCILSYIIVPQLASFTSIWLVIITTTERTVSIVWPFKITKIFSKNNCKIIIAFMIIFFITLTSSAGLCSEYNKPKPYLCSLKVNGFCKYYFNNVYQIFKSLFGSWLPSLFGICLNTIFIIFLNRISNKRKNITTNNTNSTKKEKQITIMILVISISFVILTLPYSLFELMRKTLHQDTFYSIISRDRVRDFQRATLLLIDLNHSTNFIFYVLAAERFRNQLIKILTFWKKINTKERAIYSKTNQTVEINI